MDQGRALGRVGVEEHAILRNVVNEPALQAMSSARQR